MAEVCPVCDSELEARAAAGDRDAIKFSCPRCGNFMLARSLIANLPKTRSSQRDASAKISHALRRDQESNTEVMFTTHTVDAVLEQPLPRPREQADLLIRWLAENQGGPGELVWLEPPQHAGIIGAKSAQGFALVLDHLFQVGLVTGNRSNAISAPGIANATLTFAGWEHYENLRAGAEVYRKAFMAMKFGDAVLDSVLERVFRPSVKQAGFDLVRLDDNPAAGLIDNRLRVEIQTADFIIADLSHDNLGAYWEAGYAEGLRKPVIYTCEKKKFEAFRTHFDTNHHLTIIWDAETPEVAGEALKATIRATLPHLAKQVDDL